MEAAMRILYLEDDPASVDLVASQLTRDGINAQITQCVTQEEFIAALAQNIYGVFLAKYEFPGLDPLDFVKAVRARRPIIPFIFISETPGEETAIECLKAGADDYLLRKNISRIAAAIRTARAQIKVRKMARKTQGEMERKLTDRTTKLSECVQSLQTEIKNRTESEQVLREKTEQLRTLASHLTLAEQHERQRIAKALHDGLMQLMAAARMEISRLEKSSANETVVQAGNLLDQAIATVRSINAELSPDVLRRQAGLVPALKYLVEWLKEHHQMKVAFQSDVVTSAESPDACVLLYHSVREILLNARMAGVTSATVKVIHEEGRVRVELSGMGSGFDPDWASSASDEGAFGMFGIDERLAFLGGKIIIENASKKNARIVLEAPATGAESYRKVTPTKVVEEPAEMPHATPPPQDEKRVRVLIADDHVVMRQGLSHLLEEAEKVSVVGEASDGPTAVNLTRKLVPDVVLMDVSMPGMNGIEATRLIHSEFPHICIIGLSMFDEVETNEAMRDAGAAAYVIKSGATESLISTIQSCIARHTF